MNAGVPQAPEIKDMRQSVLFQVHDLRGPKAYVTMERHLYHTAKRASKKSISYLTIDAVKYLLEQIPKDTKHGRRDMTLLALMYHTGARVQEIIDLTPESVRTSKPYTVELLGKGTKEELFQ